MHLKELEISGFKSFAKKVNLKFSSSITAVVGPNGSGKSNIAEAFRFVLGEQSFKSMRGKRGEDLIFNGTATVVKQSKANVKLVFDNRQKILPIDFEEVAIERIVHRDGVNEYLINGSQVRLKDIVELLASANIGSSGHHIISQGEADRILNSSAKERKAMLEDALGLKIYQYKKNESERKLQKSEENIKQVESLRKEIAPHIKFLKKQVEKIEEAKRVKEELLVFYREYLKRESEYLKKHKSDLAKNVDGPRKRLSEIEKEISEAEKLTQNQNQNQAIVQIKDLELQVSEITSKKESLLKELGRIEGQISSLISLKERHKNSDESISVTKTELENLRNQIKEVENESENVGDINSLKILFKKISSIFSDFFSSKNKTDDVLAQLNIDIDSNKKRQIEISETLSQISREENEIRSKIKSLRQKVDEDKSSSLQAEKQIVILMSEKNEIQQELSKHAIALDTLNRDEISFKQELTEAAVLVGREVLDFENLQGISTPTEEPREVQSDRRKKLERMKIKLEEMGAGNSDEVTREYNEVMERDGFLMKELEDLEKTIFSLKELIADLSSKIETLFHEGIEKINKEFQQFFESMFGGGTASIKVIKTEPRRRKDTDFDFDENSGIPEEPTEAEEGIEIKVNLPRKKINDLMMLSGGERALTSIALLFAISQVNPPPFVILDETDAALDEANSRKYGDMIHSLSKNSQLILITHNRETMSRAGMLYGITMNSGVSQILSVALEEGEQWAK